MTQPPRASDPSAATATPEADLAELRHRMARASRWVVLSGAGMSAESGIPTFRDAQTGLWAHLDPEQLASEAGYRADPALVWDWYETRREGVRQARPNAGHVALANYAHRFAGRLTVITQNVDDLHQRAGSPGVLRLHGDLLADRWLGRCAQPSFSGHGCEPRQARPGRPPHCSRCGNLVRPGVVWFGEPLPATTWAQAEAAVDQAELLLVVGTSGAVWPAAGLAARARRHEAFVAVLNPATSAIDDEAHLHLRGTAATLLPALLDPLR
ncbi:SIR2 family NAD-dependent protein deacylase [Ideonella livida]|nr:NAD-dependent deacylase [Ideonella livida]